MDTKTKFMEQVKAMPGTVVTVQDKTVTVMSPDLTTWNKVDDLLQETGWLSVFGGNPNTLTHGATFVY